MMIKRLFDVVMSLLGFVALSPFFLFIALVIKLISPGPIFYRATRVGLRGQHFKLYKFRSMVADADKVGPGITAVGDQRITSVGRILRRYKLDEFPQLINVFRGEMSLVGPRPEDPRYVELYTLEQRRVLEVRPGITSLASVVYRHEEQMLQGDDWEDLYIKDVMPSKLTLDQKYAINRTLWMDIGIILRTLLAIVKKRK